MSEGDLFCEEQIVELIFVSTFKKEKGVSTALVIRDVDMGKVGVLAYLLGYL